MARGNYPPGMSKRDFIRAGIDEAPNAPGDHDCSLYLEPLDANNYPLFEDAAARFYEICTYAKVINSVTSARGETYEDYGPICGREQNFDMDIRSISHEETRVRFPVTRHPVDANTVLENRLIEEVMAAILRDEHEIVDVDPCPRGEVIVRLPEQALRVRFAP